MLQTLWAFVRHEQFGRKLLTAGIGGIGVAIVANNRSNVDGAMGDSGGDCLSASAASAANIIPFYSHKPGQPYACFSNFFRHAQAYKHTLAASVRHESFPSSVPCLFSERAIMASKAALFKDTETFRAICEADDPRTCKALGRRVKGFDQAAWDLVIEDLATDVVYQKFAADERCAAQLLSTGAATLAEATSKDKVWGIGLDMDDPRVHDPAQWQGSNILGKALMRARKKLSTERVCNPIT